MSPSPVGALVVVLLAVIGLPACADQPIEPADILDYQLDRLESRVIQRQGRPPRTRDLLTDGDLRVSEQRLNTLKTKTPRSGKIPLLERQFDRIQRPIGPKRFRNR